MEAIGAELETEAKKGEEWVEKETGLIEHRITTSKAYHSAEHIAASIDRWIEGAAGTLDEETSRYYGEASIMIKGLFK